MRKSLIVILLGSSLLASADDAAKALARRVDRHYNALKTIRMAFVENLESAGIKRTESGMLELKKPGRMRWDYAKPRQKLFVSDGKTAYFYVPGDQQARKAPLKKLDDLHSPLRYLLGKSRLEDELERVRLDGNVITGVPKHLKDRVQQVALTINASDQIERIVIEEVDGTRTEFAFTAIQENVPLADAQFKFVLPAGVEMVEAKELQP